MANRNFNRYQALEKEVKAIYAQFTMSSGTPVLDVINSKGVESVTKISTGKYEIKLADKYNALLQLVHSREYTGAGAIGINVFIRSEDVANTRAIVIESVDATGTGIDFLNNTKIRIKLDLKNSSVR